MYFPFSMNQTFHQKQLSTILYFGLFPPTEFPRKNVVSDFLVSEMNKRIAKAWK